MPLKLQSLITSFYAFKTMLYPQVCLICCVLPSALSHFPDYAESGENEGGIEGKNLQKWYLKKLMYFIVYSSNVVKVEKPHAD